MTAWLPAVRSFPSHPSTLFHVRKFVREQAARAGMAEQAIADLVLAVSEACANAVIHTAGPNVKVSVRLLEDRLEVLVQDQGVFRRHVPMPELGEEGGHGIPLMTALVDEMTIREGNPGRPGTLVRLVKSLRR